MLFTKFILGRHSENTMHCQVFILFLCLEVLFLNVFGAINYPSTEYHIVPSTMQKSNCSHCITFSQFANDPKRYTSSSTKLRITGGNYILSKHISISNIVYFSLLPLKNGTDSIPEIICNNHANFAFVNITSIKISGLTLIGCAGNHFEYVDQAVLESSKIIGNCTNSTSLITVVESNVRIVDMSFLSNSVRELQCNQKTCRHFKMASIFVTGTVGGALTVTHSNLKINNCLFEGNSANIGGAIFSEAESNITISSSNFTSNYAGGCDHSHCSGGDLFIAEHGTVVVQNCNFQNSTSDGYGGMAVIFNASLRLLDSYADNSTSGIYGGVIAAFRSISLEFQVSLFHHSKTKKYGGALYLGMHTGHATINNSHFANNTALFGGAISMQRGATVVIDNCKFSNNTAKDSGAALHSHTQCNTTIIQSTFIGNKANRNGVILADHESFIDLKETTFHSSHIGDDGGVVFLDNKSKTVIKSCEFTNNVAKDTGGAVSARNGSTITVNSSLFNVCTADHGGCIYAKVNCNITIVNCTFINNTANWGGVVNVKIGSIVVIKNCKFKRNIAKTDGGVLISRIKSKVNISNSTFNHNSAGNDGTFFIHDTSTVTLENDTFIGNTADNNGGVAYVFDRSNITIKDCHFINNSARIGGGALYVRKISIISIANSQFCNCTTADSGGVLYAQFDCRVYINTSNFTTSEADCGGAIYVDYRSESKIANSIFTSNRGRINGGTVAAYRGSIMQFQTSEFTFNVAIYGGVVNAIQNCNLTFNDCRFLHNKAELGGVFKVVQVNPLNIICSMLQHNQADFGGVLHIGGSMIVSNLSSYDHNHARYSGGCMYIKNESIIGINSDKIFNNSAEIDGGVLDLSGKSITNIESSNFSRNGAHGKGGVISLQKSSANIHFSTFDLSTVGNKGETTNYTWSSFAKLYSKIGDTFADCGEKSGGVLHLDDNSNSTIIQSNFTRNRAENCGGVITTSLSSNVIIDNNNFDTNEAKRGGALALLKASSIIIHCREVQLINNRAVFGGAIYLGESNAFFKSIISFNHNQATSLGGGIFAIYSSIMIGNTTNFCSNNATLGGGISLRYSNLYDIARNESILSNVNFLSNRAHNGGAIYIHDEEEGSLCCNNPYAAIYGGGCFFQNVTDGLRMNFTGNYAMLSGDNLYGGLLDRCAVINIAEKIQNQMVLLA